jgi:hypothetical protein
MTPKNLGILKGSILFSAFVVSFVCAVVVTSNMQTAVIQPKETYQKSWHLEAVAGEGNPGAGAGGILEIFFINYTAGKTPTSNSSTVLESYSKNIGWQGWNNTDNFRQRVNLSTFYIVVRVRGNATQCNRTTFWQDTDLRVLWTCADLGIGADTVMERVVTQNGTGSYLWVNFYDDNSNAGFHLDKSNTWPDNPVNITSIKFEAYY